MSKGDLRWVTESQAKKHPSKIALGQKICSKCRKMLSKLPAEEESPPYKPYCLSGEGGQKEVKEKSEMDDDNTFISTESDLGTVNRSLEFIGISPLKRKDIERTPSYVPRKKQRVQEAISARIDVALSAQSQKSETEKTAECLVSKYKVQQVGVRRYLS